MHLIGNELHALLVDNLRLLPRSMLRGTGKNKTTENWPVNNEMTATLRAAFIPRRFSLLASALALGLVATLSPVSAAVANGCDGFGVGVGSAESPYQVSNRAQLEAVGQCLGAGTYFVQTAHIDLGGSARPWSPLAATDGFAGNFDGDSYEIGNLYVRAPGLAGLFAKLDGATITNLKLTDADVASSNTDAGILAGFVSGSTIEDSLVTGVVLGRNLAGGLIGMTQGTRSFVTRVASDVAVDSEVGNAGGLFGQIEFQSATVTDVFVAGSVNTEGMASGGAVGYGIAPNINRAVSVALVTGGKVYRGGLIGLMANNDSVLTNSFFLDSAVTQVVSDFAVAKSAEQLRDIATFSAATFSIGDTADSATTWRILADVNSGYPQLAAASFVRAAATAAPVADTVYRGPMLEVPGPLSPVRAGSKLTLLGSNLAGISSLQIAGIEVEFEITGDEITFVVPRGLAAGVYDLLITSSAGRLTVQDAIRVSGSAASSGAAGDLRASTRMIDDGSLKVWVFGAAGDGKVQIKLNGQEVAWVNATSADDPKLRDGYLVRTLTLAAGKNVIEVYVDGERVSRRVATGS